MPTDSCKYFFFSSTVSKQISSFNAPFESQVNEDSELRDDLPKARIG